MPRSGGATAVGRRCCGRTDRWPMTPRCSRYRYILLKMAAIVADRELAALDRQVSELVKAERAAMQQRDIPTMRRKMQERQQVTRQRAAKQEEVAAAAVAAAVAQVHAKDGELERGGMDPAAIAQETARLEAALILN